MNDTSLKDWQHFYHEAFSSLKPGGWVESQEFDYHRDTDDDTIAEDSRLKHWEEEWTRGIERTGLKGKCDPELVVTQMRNAGFVHIQRLDFKLPVGPWPRDPQLRQAGLFGLVNLLDGMSSLSMKIFTGLLGYSTEELEILLMQCRQEIKDKAVHSYWPV